MTFCVPWERERQRVVDQILEHLHQPFLGAHDNQVLLYGFQHDFGATAALAIRLAIIIHQHLQFLADIGRFDLIAAQFGVEARGVGDIADQPIEAVHIVANDDHQLLPRKRIKHALLGGLPAALRVMMSADF